MGQTTGDSLPWPELNEAANVPQDMQELATATQTALNKRAPIALTSATISRASGWANAFPTAKKSGNVVTLSGIFQRNDTLTVTANTAYTIGTLPAGYRPVQVERCACAWSAEGTRRVGQVWLMGDGSIDWYPTVGDDLAVDDWVSVSSVTFTIV